MKILQIAQTLDVRTGGVARAVILLSEALAHEGHAVEIVTLDPVGTDWSSATSLKVHSLGNDRGGYGYARELRPWLRSNRGNFDRVIVNGLWQYASFAAWRCYAGSQIPYYVFPHGMLDPWFKRTYLLKHLKKWLYWPWAEYRVLRDARAVIFTSEEERRQARESFWLYRCREEISPLGVEAPANGSVEEYLTRFPDLREKRVILFLGRLHPKKGCDLLLDAFARVLPNDQSFALVMAGPDQSDGELQKRAGRNVIFAGMLEGSMKWSALKAAEVFILPSHQENFGLSVVEALACGVPVLISNRVNIWREIETDGAGYVENDDLAGTARLLERWLATPSGARETMRANARRCFETRFEIQRAAQSLLRILE
ncbi:MAG: glycosyltransferase [Verrucomicrobiota bacterium]|nr:glycosyltransferase [Verrucomicrobiota bacterium]